MISTGFYKRNLHLWFPVGNVGKIEAQEVPLRAFTMAVKGLYDVPYWKHIKRINLTSTDRRVGRCKII